MPVIPSREDDEGPLTGATDVLGTERNSSCLASFAVFAAQDDTRLAGCEQESTIPGYPGGTIPRNTESARTARS